MVFAAVMVAAIVVAGILLYRTTVGEDVLTRLADDTGIELPGARPSGALTITGLATFDPPPGDGTENDELLALAADGDPSTAWRTERYDTRALGGLKPGVGVVVTLEEAARLRRLEVGSPTSGWAAEIYVADVAGATLVDWGDPVASQTGIAGDATFEAIFEIGGYLAEGGVVLVWVTVLGGSEGRPAAEISTVEVFGT